MAGRTQNSQTNPEEYLPLTPAELNILLSLAGEDLHGYGIMREVERRTEGKTRLGPGTLYRSIKQMLERGWIEEVGEDVDPNLGSDRRRYYRLSGAGRRVATLEVERLEELVRSAREAGLRVPGEGSRPNPGFSFSPTNSRGAAAMLGASAGVPVGVPEGG